MIALGSAMPAVLAAAGGAGAGVAALLTALGVVLFGGAVLLSWALAPKSFAVEGTQVRVDRPFRPVVIPLTGLRSVGPLPDGALRGTSRLVGSSGLFGYYGRCWNRRLGAFRLHATRRSGLVLLEAAGELFVLSPEPAGRFVEDVLGRAAGAVRAEGAMPVERRPIPRRSWITIALVVALVPVGLAGVVADIFAFTPCGVRVDAGAIRIEREVAAPVVIPLADVRHVELLPRDRTGGFRRVSGARGPRVRYGRYRSDALGDFRLYAWRPGGPYVLLDTVDARIVLTPDDPETFVAAVRAGIGGPRARRHSRPRFR
jgi:hypothetical protein